MRAGNFVATGAGIVLASTAAGRASILVFSDNFNVTAGANTANYQSNFPSRQGGLAAPLSYIESPAGDDPHHQVFAAAPYANLGQPLMISADGAANNVTVSPHANFATVAAAALNFTLELDINPNDPRVSSSSGASGLGISFGAAAPGVGVDSAADHLGVFFRGDGRYQLFDGANNVTLPASANDIVTAGGGQYTHISISVSDPDGNPFDGNGNALVTLSSNFGGVFAIYSRADLAGNAITFQARSADAKVSVQYIDNVNLTVSPEPGSASLLIVGAAGLLLRRRAVGRPVGPGRSQTKPLPPQ